MDRLGTDSDRHICANKKIMAAETQKLIRDAAFRVFSQKGFAAASMRDIANEAGVNHALINYYYDSKSRLFYEVMVSNMQSHLSYLTSVFNEPSSTWKEKIQKVIDFYSDFLISEPEKTRFVFNEMAKSSAFSESIEQEVNFSSILRGSILEKQILEQGIPQSDIPNLFINLIGLVSSPIITAPLSMAFCGLDQERYIKLFIQRKNMIIPWVEKMFSISVE